MVLKLLQSVFSVFLRRYQYRRLIEFDGSHLIQKYGPSAVSRALELEAQGVLLSGDRREGHWLRVARCIAGRPLPTRSETAFG